MKFVKPDLKHIDSYISGLEKGPFTYMALAYHGDWEVDKVLQDPEGYIAHANDTSPRIVEAGGEDFVLEDHKLLWVLNSKDEFIGGISLRFDNNEMINNYAGHAGMSVRHDLIGKGFGVRAAIAGYEYAFKEARKRGLKEFIASAHTSNPNSYRLIEHIGFIHERNVDAYGWGEARLYKYKL